MSTDDQDLPPLPRTPPGRYRHYKGGEYEIVGAARHSETLEPLVVYRPLYNSSGLWVRPHAMFFENIMVNGQERPRFAAMVNPTTSLSPAPSPVRSPAPSPSPDIAQPAARITVAPIAAEHVGGFHHCLDTVAREQRYLAQIEAPPLEKVRGFVHDSIASDVAQFVALDGEQVVGLADIFPHWAHALAHTGSLGMSLLPAYRGQGIGRQLLLACIDKARSQGITRVTLEARIDNTRAIALYESVGFQRETVKQRALRFEGVYFDALQMSLLLPEPEQPAS